MSLAPQPLTPTPFWYACVHQPGAPPGALCELAHDFSPRYEAHGDDRVVIDVSGLERLFGEPRQIGDELQRSAVARHLRVQVAIAATRTAAMILATTRPGVTVVRRGGEALALASIPIGVLERFTNAPGSPGASRPGDQFSSVAVVKHWGLRTLGELAALPPDALAARLGPRASAWHSLARGQDAAPMVPTLAAERFASSIELEWPIEGLEPLSFVLTRLLEPLSTRLERRDRGAAALHVELGLVVHRDVNNREHGEHRDQESLSENQRPAVRSPSGEVYGVGVDRHDHGTHRHDRADGENPGPTTSVPSVVSVVNGCHGDTYTRTLQLPAPMRDVRTLRTLILLDLESHPPSAPIERVSIVIDPTPGRVLQHTLFARATPTPEQLSTLVARLNALMGEDRVGCPALVDSYRPGAFGMRPFDVDQDQERGRGGSRGRRGTSTPSASSLPSTPCPASADSSASSDVSVSSACLVSCLRRCRHPVPARVALVDGRLTAVTTDRHGFPGGRVLACAGPWRSSGNWWNQSSVVSRQSGVGSRESSVDSRQTPVASRQLSVGSRQSLDSWFRDEWDVSLSDGVVYRIFQDRTTDGWFIDAIVD